MPISTIVKTLKAGNESSLVEIGLVTGKTHQIRAHLAYHGHFIIGDGKYGAERVNKLFKVKSQLLISSTVIFTFDSKSPLFYLDKKQFFVDNKRVFDYLK